MNAFLELWKNKHEQEDEKSYLCYCAPGVPKHTFLPDGIIQEAQYKCARKKVLFIAKEANWFSKAGTDEHIKRQANDSYFWLRSVAEESGDHRGSMFSKRISLLANAILNNDYVNINTDQNILKKIAFINLNKRGGFSDCIPKTLEGYVAAYASEIRTQIAMIAPDIIICCGFGVTWLTNKYQLISSQTKTVTVYHPSYFALSHTEYLYQLECAIKGVAWTPKDQKDCYETRSPKGIIFDTNKTHSFSATIDMLTNNKIGAYGKASRFIDRFQYGDYVFYYVTGMGIVAAGQIVSEKALSVNEDERYKMVRLIVPEHIPENELDLCAISAKELKILLNKSFYFASTVKAPYLKQEECNILVATLQKKYLK